MNWGDKCSWGCRWSSSGRSLLSFTLLLENRTESTIRHWVIPVKALLLMTDRAFKGAPIHIVKASAAKGEEKALAARKW
jgi:hypothetical protein